MRAERALAFLTALALAGCEPAKTVSVDMSGDADCKTNPVACGGCLTDSDCKSGGLVRCNPLNNACVPCLPVNDNCGSGQVCHPANGSFQCLTTCTADTDCIKLGGGSSCCEGVCVALASDDNNCGACGRTCAAVNNGEPGCNEGACIIRACNQGFDDCNKSPDDGCETPTGSDALNCGGCGMLCEPFKNGIPGCTNSICSATCAIGYADCNNSVNDGCEIDTTFDVSNCGACGKTCTAPANSLAFCDQGACGFRCKVGFSDCDGNRNNGCESSVNGDANNCGHCGNVCPIRLNAQGPACNNGLCGNSCNPNFGDCDGNPANGCESNTNTDLNNCGGCGMICSNNHATNTCAQGACTLKCAVGFFDCDMDSKNGCESNPLQDGKNCGGCGNLCPVNTPFCVKGMCSDKNPAVVFSEMFTQGLNDGTQCAKWQAFQALLVNQFTAVTISGTNDQVGVTCNSANEANMICQALRQNQAVSVVCNGRTWRTGACGSGTELSATGNICSCDSPAYLLRPCIGNGNSNWGGVMTTSCGAPSQTMTVSCQ